MNIDYYIRRFHQGHFCSNVGNDSPTGWEFHFDRDASFSSLWPVRRRLTQRISVFATNLFKINHRFLSKPNSLNSLELTGTFRSISTSICTRTTRHRRFIDDHLNASHGCSFDTVGEYTRLFDFPRFFVHFIDHGDWDIFLSFGDVYSENLAVGRIVLFQIHGPIENEQLHS